MNQTNVLRKVRFLTLVFIVGLLVSGLTAIPLVSEVEMLSRWFGANAASPNELLQWLAKVREALVDTAGRYPFLFYGTDWLAFGHVMIAVVFIGAWRDPVRNKWLFDFGLIACVLVVPWAFLFGTMRGIPIFWRMIDCSFGVFGWIPLWYARKMVGKMEAGRIEQHQ